MGNLDLILIETNILRITSRLHASQLYNGRT